MGFESKILEFQVHYEYTYLKVNLKSTQDGLEKNPVYTRKRT